MGALFSSGKKSAKEQAAATIKSAEMSAAQDRLMAQAAVQSKETVLAQDAASRRAAETLSYVPGQAEVQLGEQASTAIDPTTGRRQTARSTYRATSAKAGAGIRL